MQTKQNQEDIKMENSKIEWTDHTFNPWIGCQKVSPGCDHCYAETMMDHRYGKVEWGPHGERKRTSDENWKKPVKWNREAEAFRRNHGHRPRVFCASLADVFDNQVPAAWRKDLFELIRKCDKMDWLLLTKRPQNILKMLPPDWGAGYPNVWLGMTAEDQPHFDQRWKHLQKIPASIKFVSYEPALGPLHLPNSRSSTGLAYFRRGKWWWSSTRKATMDPRYNCGLPRAWRRRLSQAVGVVSK